MPMLAAHAAPEEMLEGMAVRFAVRKLNAVVGKHRVQPVGHCLDQMAQKVRRDPSGVLLVQFGVGKFGCAVDGHKQIQLTFFSLHLRNVNMKSRSGTS